jgi:V8-like Glu-specific endopeptidase
MLSLLLVICLPLFFTACDITEEQAEEEEDRGQEKVDPISQEVSASDADAARDYWTAERMLDASPVEGTGIGQDSEDPPAPTDPDIPGPNVQMEQREGSQPEVGKIKGLKNVIQGDTQVNDASEVSTDYTQYPYRTVGKVFFTKDDGRRFSCSAAVIASENRSVVWTAGHCVAEQGEEDWHDRFGCLFLRTKVEKLRLIDGQQELKLPLQPGIPMVIETMI